MATTDFSSAPQTARAGAPGRGGAGPDILAAGKPALVVLLFVCIMLPVNVELGGLNLSLVRLLLLATMIPNAILLASGRLGRMGWVDALFMLHALWIVLSLIYNHGMTRIQFAGISAIEVAGSYLLGRACIRNAADFRLIFKCLVATMVIMAPFAVAETITGEIYLAEWLGPIGDVAERGRSAYPRMGFERVYAVFAHPIHFGIYCSMALGGILYALKWSGPAKVAGSGLTFGMTFLSLSSGPLLAFMMQIGIAAWGWITRGAYWRLIQLSIFAYVAIDLLSNRTPARIFVGMITFNPASGWARIIQYEFASKNISKSPIFGIGMNDWVRPHWVTNSIDNFWLATALRYGWVGAGLLLGAFLLQAWYVGRAKIADEDSRLCRRSFNTILVGLIFTMFAVHVWGSIATFVFFFLGAGSWLYTSPSILEREDGQAGEPEAAPAPKGRYARRASAAPAPAPMPAAAPAPAAEAGRYTRFGPERIRRRQERKR